MLPRPLVLALALGLTLSACFSACGGGGGEEAEASLVGTGTATPRTSGETATTRSEPRTRKYSHTGVYEPFTSIVTRRYKNPYRMRRGVPMVDYPHGAHRNPVTTAQLGLISWSQWKRFRMRGALTVALRQADWLVSTQPRSGMWEFDFAYEAPGTTLKLRKGWNSGLAQGQAISLLVRAYDHTGKRKYLTAARRAATPMSRPVVRGGLARQLDGRGVWFEEYPTDPPSYVLNGNLFAIVGVWDLSRIDRKHGTLFRRAAETAARSLRQFDDGQGSAWYDLLYRRGYDKHVAAPVYPPLVEDALRVLGQISGRREFVRWADAWRAPAQPQDG